MFWFLVNTWGRVYRGKRVFISNLNSPEDEPAFILSRLYIVLSNRNIFLAQKLFSCFSVGVCFRCCESKEEEGKKKNCPLRLRSNFAAAPGLFIWMSDRRSASVFVAERVRKIF